MADSTLNALTAATAATGGLFYGTQGGADRKFSLSAAGAAIAEAADAAAQRTALGLVIGTHVAAYNAEREKLGLQGTNVASASTTNLETATGQLIDVTGTTTITAITLSQGHVRLVRFTGALTLTHGSSLVLPTAANITTAAGDVAIFAGYASSVVRCLGYTRANGQPLAGGGGGAISTPGIYYAITGPGNDTTGDGSLSSPYATAQKAYDVGVATGLAFGIVLGRGTYTITDLTGINSLMRHIQGAGLGIGWGSALTNLTISTQPADVTDNLGTAAAPISVATDDMDVNLVAIGGGVNETDGGPHQAGAGANIEHYGNSHVAAYSRGGTYNSTSPGGTVYGGQSGTIKLLGGRVYAANADYGVTFSGGTPQTVTSASSVELHDCDARGASDLGLATTITAGRSSFAGSPTFLSDKGGNSVGW